MESCPSDDRLQQLLDNRLSSAEAEALELHLTTCSGCDARLRELTDDASTDRWRQLYLDEKQKRQVERPYWLHQVTNSLQSSAVDASGKAAGSGRPDKMPPDGPAIPQIAGFEVYEELGRGGMGVVFRARQQVLDRPVALKMILHGPWAGQGALERMRVEAEAIALLRHPNFVQIYEIGQHDGCPFIVLEYVEGGTLAEFLNGTPRDPREAAETIETLARAIHHAHQNGILHRDLKPSNIMLQRLEPERKEGQVVSRSVSGRLSAYRLKVTDLGLAKRFDRPDSTRHTGTRDILGSPHYMAPEQARGGRSDVGPYTDVYALGVILHELLVGRPPFTASTPAKTLLAVAEKEPVPLRRLQSRVPRDLETICLKCLAKEPSRRYATAADLADDLQRYRKGMPIQARPIPIGERLVLWARRQPLLAAASAAIALLLFAVLIALGWGFVASSRRAEEATRRAEAEHREAVTERARADLETRARQREEDLRRETEQLLSETRVTLAEREWLAGNNAAARRLLEQCRPQTGQPDRRGWEWHYVDRLCRAEVAVLPQPYWAQHAAFSPDGRLLATAAGSPGSGTGDRLRDGEVRLYDAETYSLLAVLARAPLPAQKRVRFNLDGSWLLACDVRNTWRIWEVASNRLALETVAADVAVLADHRTLGVLRYDGTYEHFDLARGTKVRSFSKPFISNSDTADEPAIRGGFDASAKRLAVRPDGPGPTALLDAMSADVLQEVSVRGETFFGIQFGFGGDLFCEGGQLVDLSSHSKLGEVVGGYADCVLSPNEQWVVQLDHASPAIYRASDGDVVQRLWGHSGRVNDAVFSPDSQVIATAGTDRTVRLWHVPTGHMEHVLRGHTSGVRSVEFDSVGKRLVSTGQDGTVRIWDVGRSVRGRLIPSHNGLGEFVNPIAFQSDGEKLMWVRHGTPCGFWVHDLATGVDSTHPLDVKFGTAFRCPDATFSADGRYLASVDAAEPNLIQLRETPPGGPCRTLVGHRMPVMEIAVDGSGRTVAGMSYGSEAGGVVSGTVRFQPKAEAPSQSELLVWHADAEKGRPPLHIDAPPSRCVAISRDGRLLAAAGFDQVLRVWLVGEPKPIYETTTPNQTVVTLAFDNDDAMLAAGSMEGTISIWTIAERPELLVTFQSTSAITCVTFSPNGRRLATGGFDGTVRLWDTKSGRRVFALQSVARWRPDDYSYKTHIAFSPDGSSIAANNWDGSISLWETK